MAAADSSSYLLTCLWSRDEVHRLCTLLHDNGNNLFLETKAYNIRLRTFMNIVIGTLLTKQPNINKGDCHFPAQFVFPVKSNAESMIGLHINSVMKKQFRE